MNFDYIHKIAENLLKDHDYYIDDVDSFYRFIDEFNIVSVRWGQPYTISASYFLRLLQAGSSSRARGYGRGNNMERDDSTSQMMDFYTSLLDHGALWRTKNGNVICTALPYGDQNKIEDAFYRMKEKYSYPEGVKLLFLDEKYKFRRNGDCMILIYYDPSCEEIDLNCTEEELRRKAIYHSGTAVLRRQTMNTFVRDRYISEYAKRRAHGICQLCGQPAPFVKKNGEPFLETHHIIWLADGGEDSLENTVALCPNCHRKMHECNLEEDVDKLLRITESS